MTAKPKAGWVVVCDEYESPPAKTRKAAEELAKAIESMPMGCPLKHHVERYVERLPG